MPPPRTRSEVFLSFDQNFPMLLEKWKVGFKASVASKPTETHVCVFVVFLHVCAYLYTYRTIWKPVLMQIIFDNVKNTTFTSQCRIDHLF